LFRSRVDVPERWGEYYDRSVRTLVMARQRRHGLSYGY
jgi:hypothetical protein